MSVPKQPQLTADFQLAHRDQRGIKKNLMLTRKRLEKYTEHAKEFNSQHGIYQALGDMPMQSL